MEGTEDLEGASCIMAGGAGEGQVQGLLCPALLNVGSWKGLPEDAQHVLQEESQLLPTLDVVHSGGYVLVTPQWTALPI